ncbi:uncharacterized protein J3D65DRAFT_664368 [Phyllosticta citribraziliensis]|uniref:NACHT domain-containing protein n=1 Tax=Phyllosticta citribraziliensis TaxID=989973 RepID=A0ABR1MD46_9PEZI
MSDPSTYTVGWICAITTESIAARQFLDEEHDPPGHVSHHDNNTYTLGRIGRHRVVIAVLPHGEYGITNAAGVARDMLHSFPNVRIGLMVGIGGGAPSSKNDIRLGDVAVSSPGGGQGGILQYDYGRAIQGLDFQHSGFLNQPQMLLLTAVADLRGRHLSDGNQIHEHIEAILANKKRLKRLGFQRPDLSSDRLFLSDYTHKDSDKSCDECCLTDGDKVQENDSPQTLVKRSERTEDDDNPEVHYGLIASANTLMKNAEVRDSFATVHGVLCFEMEAAGLMNHFPCLIIRGICDYSDTHKNKAWQGYAAMAAAAYAKDLLGRIAPQRVEAEPKLSEALSSIQEEINTVGNITRDMSVSIQKTHAEIHHDKILSWLSAPDPSTNYRKALKQRHPGSGQWFIQSPTYSEWKTAPKSFLWLHGIPGCGKTILSSTIIEDLQVTNTLGKPLYFFFDFTENQKQGLENTVRSLIYQLYRESKDVREHLDHLHPDCNGGKQPSTDSLSVALLNMVCAIGEVWIVLDALDECGTRAQRPNGGLCAWIAALQSAPQANVHLLVTSRPEHDIQTFIERHAQQQVVIRIQSELITDDIRAYVRGRVRQHDGLRRWWSRPRIQDEIETALLQKADGMFRWVSCQLDAIEECRDPLTLREALKSLPATLDDTYARILKTIPAEIKRPAIRILQFLTFSNRPLRIEEVVDAIAVEVNQKPRFDTENRMPVPEEVAGYCSSLVAVVKKHYGRDERIRTEVQLAHFSVKEYLTSPRLDKDIAPDLNEHVSRATIAEVCLAYWLGMAEDLSEEQIGQFLRRAHQNDRHWAARIRQVAEMEDVPKQFQREQISGLRQQAVNALVADQKNIEECFPLARYAARHWASHALVAETSSEEVRRLATDFFSSEHCYETCYRQFAPDDPWSHREDHYQEPGPALYHASLSGLVSAVEVLIDKGAEVNGHGGYFGNALQAASWAGHTRVIRTLLENGARINALGGKYGTALQAASFAGRDQVVRMLLDEGADIRALGGACNGFDVISGVERAQGAASEIFGAA